MICPKCGNEFELSLDEALIGVKIGKLTIKAIDGYKEKSNSKSKRVRKIVYYKCLCDCGKEVIYPQDYFLMDILRKVVVV
jgi:hypothetical protein